MEKLRRLEVGWEKWRAGAQKRKYLQIEEKLGYYGGPIGSLQRSFQWYRLDPLRPPLSLD